MGLFFQMRKILFWRYFSCENFILRQIHLLYVKICYENSIFEVAYIFSTILLGAILSIR